MLVYRSEVSDLLFFYYLQLPSYIYEFTSAAKPRVWSTGALIVCTLRIYYILFILPPLSQGKSVNAGKVMNNIQASICIASWSFDDIICIYCGVKIASSACGQQLLKHHDLIWRSIRRSSELKYYDFGNPSLKKRKGIINNLSRKIHYSELFTQIVCFHFVGHTKAPELQGHRSSMDVRSWIFYT